MPLPHESYLRFQFKCIFPIPNESLVVLNPK